MKDYLLLLRGGDARMATLNEQEIAAHMQQWNIYMRDLAEKGNLIGGLPLQQNGKVLCNSGVTDAIVKSERGDTIGGYLMVKAENYDQAIALSKDCPIFEHDGNIEIREIMPMDM